MLLFLLGKYQEVELLGHRIAIMFSFLRNWPFPKVTQFHIPANSVQ